MRNKSNLLTILGVYLIVPAALARWFVGAPWPAVALAFATLWAILLITFGAARGPKNERIGWAMIFGLFVSIPGVPIISAVLRALVWG
jgi:hypothetical protein